MKPLSRPLAWALSVAAAAAALAAAVESEARTTERPGVHIDVQTHVLRNGLMVLLHRDDRVPVVAVAVQYRVGSAHEPAGRTGLARLSKQLMSASTKHLVGDLTEPFEAVGGWSWASTDRDGMTFFGEIPAEQLELALWIESERMENVLPALTTQKIDTQRGVIGRDRRSDFEDRPYGMDRLWLAESLFPEGHPYHHDPTGSPADLAAVTLDDAERFIGRHCVPSNAVLAIAGDFDPKQAMDWVRRYFGHLPSGQPTPPLRDVPASLGAPVHRVEYDRVTAPRVYLAWHSPALYGQGDAAMDIAASVLSDGKSSRLYGPLVHDRRLATEVRAQQTSGGLAGWFVVQATAAPGVEVDALAAALDAALDAALESSPSPDELARSINARRKGFYFDLDSVVGKARALSSYQHLAGQADYIADDLARYTALDGAAVHRAATTWLSRPRVRLDIMPLSSAPGTGGVR